MALTVVDVKTQGEIVPGIAIRVVDVTFDNSYSTGGHALAASDLQLGSIAAVVATPKNAGGYQFVYDYSANKLLAYWCAGSGAAMVQVTAATNLSAVVARVVAIGTPE